MKPIMPFVEWLEERKFRIKGYFNTETEMWEDGGYLELFDFQKRILTHCLTPDEKGRFPYRTILYSAPKKSGKTTIGAAITAWATEQLMDGSHIYVLANDKQQAGERVFDDVAYNALKNPNWSATYVGADLIEYPNGTKIQVLAKENKSAAGGRHALTVWDELWGYTTELQRRMYAEMTPVPTVPVSLRVIVTYAGYEGEGAENLLWDLYVRGVGPDEHKDGKGTKIPELEDLPCWKSGRQFTYWDHEHRLPWQTEDYYEEESVDLRPGDVLRLHYNQWASSEDAFIDIDWWDRAAVHYEQGAEIWADHPYRRSPVFLGVDVAPKLDRTAVAGVTYDARLGKMVLLFHHIWDPQGKDLDFEATVEAYLRDHARRFDVRAVDYDPAQFHRSQVTLKGEGLPMREFSQQGGQMIDASNTLFKLLKHKNLWAYPDDDARTHIKNAVAKSTPRGFRLIKDPALNSRNRHTKPMDFAVALAMACYGALELGAVDTTTPVRIEMPFSDVSRIDTLDLELLKLPEPFRPEVVNYDLY